LRVGCAGLADANTGLADARIAVVLRETIVVVVAVVATIEVVGSAYVRLTINIWVRRTLGAITGTGQFRL
jgi:hypothetical protein